MVRDCVVGDDRPGGNHSLRARGSLIKITKRNGVRNPNIIRVWVLAPLPFFSRDVQLANLSQFHTQTAFIPER
jgi:hypothetical protein